MPYPYPYPLPPPYPYPHPTPTPTPRPSPTLPLTLGPTLARLASHAQKRDSFVGGTIARFDPRYGAPYEAR